MAGSALILRRKPEILAPAGDLFKLRTAIAYGADAVYLAGDRFGLRQAADNFLPEELAEGCVFAHNRSKSVYVTLNAFLFDHELEELPPFLNLLEEFQVDAVIVSDLGVLEMVSKHSRLPVHVSTQASCLNVESAKFWKSKGAKRIVLGREVSIQEASKIRVEADIEVEVFIHGAMCMAYSGNCTISNYTAGRDSNRGGCAQSCRFEYTLHESGDQLVPGEGVTTSFLSSKDLRSMELMPHLIQSPIDSLKIEGRNKGPLYLATTVRNYSRAKALLFQNQGIPLGTMNLDLEKLSFRGYTQGSLVEKAGKSSVFQQEISESSTYEMIGYVVEKQENEYFAVHLRGNLTHDDFVEILAFQGEDQLLQVDQMRDASARRVMEGKPNAVLYFPDEKAVEAGMILRKKIRGDTR